MESPPRGWRGRGGRFGRPILGCAIGLAVTFLLLEAVLQIGAWVRWRERWQPASSPAREGERVVLCVGDSFTYGFGASSAAGSYPAQLEKALNESGNGSWKVVNGGWPGQNSWDVLRKLEDLLARHRPLLVYILVGTNDLWSQPPLRTLEDLPPAPAPDRFEWKWRTGRLLSLLVHRIRLAPAGKGAAGSEGDRPFLGDWHVGSVPVRFEKDGRLRFGETAARWRAAGERLVLEIPGSPDLAVRWAFGGRLLALHPDGAPAPFLLEPGPPRRDPAPTGDSGPGTEPVHRAQAALASGDLGLAVEFLQEHVEAYPEDLWARETLAHSRVKLGHVAEASEQVAWLRRRYAERPDRQSAEALLGGLVALGGRDESLALAKSLADRYPDSVRVWETIAGQAFLAGEQELAETSIEKALLALPPSDGAWRPLLLRVRAQILRKEDPSEAMASGIRAFLIDGDEACLVQQFQMGSGSATRGHFERCLRDLSLGPGDRERLERLFRRGTEGDRPPEALEGHLRQVVGLCRARGARPALLTYPNRLPPVDAVTQGLAEELRVPRLDLAAAFADALRDRRREELFVPDGHCNDAGYAIIASVAARDALRAVR